VPPNLFKKKEPESSKASLTTALESRKQFEYLLMNSNVAFCVTFGTFYVARKKEEFFLLYRE